MKLNYILVSVHLHLNFSWSTFHWYLRFFSLFGFLLFCRGVYFVFGIFEFKKIQDGLLENKGASHNQEGVWE
jgi:hypothetical protein